MTCDCDRLRSARCKSCDAPILWTRTASGATMPLDAPHSPEGKWAVANGSCVSVPEGGHVAHWATCLHAASHRRPKRAEAPTPAEVPPQGPSSNQESPSGPEIEIDWLSSEGLSLTRRIVRLVMRDQALPREERRVLAGLVARCEARLVNAALVELQGDAGVIARLGGHMGVLRDAAACCVAATWPEYQALELSLGELAGATEAAA